MPNDTLKLNISLCQLIFILKVKSIAKARSRLLLVDVVCFRFTVSHLGKPTLADSKPRSGSPHQSEILRITLRNDELLQSLGIHTTL